MIGVKAGAIGLVCLVGTAIGVLAAPPALQAIANAIYLPVASTIDWVSFTPDGGKGSRGWQLVEWRIEKYQKACKFRGMRWQLRDQYTGALTDLDWDDMASATRDPNRPAGKHDGIVTRVGSTMRIERWYVTVTHDCHPLLPNVTTVIWPEN